MIFKWSPKVARQVELCGRGWWDPQPFSWCHAACPSLRLVVRDLPLEKSIGRTIALTQQKWSVLLCSHWCLKTGAFLAWCLWPLLQILWLLVTGPEALVVFLFENEIKKNPQIWGNPQGKICFGGREACGNSAGRFWQYEVLICCIKQNMKKTSNQQRIWGFLKQLFCATHFVY